MKKSQNTIESSLKVASRPYAFDLISKSLKTSYPTAIWRLPNTQQINALIDVSKNGTAAFESLNQAESGFIINSYGHNHPIKPNVIKGDILIEITEKDVSINIDPSVSATAIDAFVKEVDGAKVRPKRNDIPGSKLPDYPEIVEEAIASIKGGRLHKVVLSRYKDHELPKDFDPIKLFQKLTTTYPSAFCYLAHTEGQGTWMGATPEKLLTVEDNRLFTTDALAGTQLLSEEKNLSEIAWTQKEIEEQAMVSRYIIDCFKQIRLRDFNEIGPRTVVAGNLLHLKTEFKVDMVETNFSTLGDQMMELLHPTSAVCGYPKIAADEFISKHEGYDRGLYAGFLGPVNFQQSSHLFVNLRCMQIIGNTARLYAGAGITEDSNPKKEFLETENKMNTLLNVLKA